MRGDTKACESSLPDAQLPKSYSACGRNVEAVNLVRHGDPNGVIAVRDGVRRKAVAFRAKHKREFFLGCQLRVVKRDGVVGKRQRGRFEPQAVQQRNAVVRPRAGARCPRVGPDASSGNLKHRAHGNAHSATIQRIVASLRNQHGVNAQGCGAAENGADVRVVRDVFKHGNAARPATDVLDAGGHGTAKRAQSAARKLKTCQLL